LSLAHDIQVQLTPKEINGNLGTDVAIFYKPAMWVGGDYCDIWTLEDESMAFAIADVSGKGLPAAMIMANLQAALRTTMRFCRDLSSVTEYINRHLVKNLTMGRFVTLFLGLFNWFFGIICG